MQCNQKNLNKWPFTFEYYPLPSFGKSCGFPSKVREREKVKQNHGQFSVSTSKTSQSKTGCSALCIYSVRLIYPITQTQSKCTTSTISLSIFVLAFLYTKIQSFWPSFSLQDLMICQFNSSLSFFSALGSYICWVLF